MNQIHPNTIRQVLFIALLLFLFYVLASETFFMFSAILGAFTLYTLMRNGMQRLVIHYRCPRPLAAGLLMLVSITVIVLPFAWIISILADRLYPYISNPAAINAYFSKVQSYILEHWNINIMSEQYAGKVFNGISAYLPQIAGSTFMTISNLTILYFILYFMLVKYDRFEIVMKNMLPLKRSNRNTLSEELRKLVLSNAISIPVLALMQGIVACIGYAVFGMSEPVLWGIITGICSVVPFVGTMIAWAPIALYLFASGDSFAGFGILIWGLFVIGSTDNVFRFILQKKLADIHPIITVFGVIIGVNLFGFFGLVFGPLLISIFILLIGIYQDEFGRSREEEEIPG